MRGGKRGAQIKKKWLKKKPASKAEQQTQQVKTAADFT